MKKRRDGANTVAVGSITAMKNILHWKRTKTNILNETSTRWGKMAMHGGLSKDDSEGGQVLMLSNTWQIAKM